MNLLQRYGDFGLIPRNWPDSCRSCCDRGNVLRQSGGMGLGRVVKGHKKRTPLSPIIVNLKSHTMKNTVQS